jgi:hypothetical protein
LGGNTISADQWAVEVREPFNTNAGYIVTVLQHTSEVVVRQLFEDRVKAAPALGYESVKLRQGDEVMKAWPRT